MFLGPTMTLVTAENITTLRVLSKSFISGTLEDLPSCQSVSFWTQVRVRHRPLWNRVQVPRCTPSGRVPVCTSLASGFPSLPGHTAVTNQNMKPLCGAVWCAVFFLFSFPSNNHSQSRKIFQDNLVVQGVSQGIVHSFFTWYIMLYWYDTLYITTVAQLSFICYRLLTWLSQLAL